MLNIPDEGHLWYGVKAISQYGDVPLLTFRGYDPGRYYWGAAWSVLIGDSLMAVRFSAMIFNAIGLSFGLLAVHRVYRKRWLLIPVAVLLLAWMFPRHKFVEASLAMALAYFGVLLVQAPTRRNYFISGVCVGLTAFFGRNLGLYGAVGFVTLSAFVYFKVDRADPLKRFLALTAGIVTGYLPMLLMIILIPGFPETFVENILFWFRQGETNLPLPVPWLWTLNFPLNEPSTFSSSVLFTLLPPFVIGMLILLFILPVKNVSRTALTAAGICIGLFFLHHAYSRADIPHIAQSVHPMLLALIGVPLLLENEWKRQLTTVLVAVFLIVVTLPAVTATPLGMWLRQPSDYVQFEIDGDTFWVSRHQAAYISAVQKFAEENPGRMAAIPYEAGIYAILDRPSPFWDNYLLFKATDEVQQEAVRAFEDVEWILLGNNVVDGRADKHLEVIYPMLWSYIQSEFEPVTVEGLPTSHTILVRQ